jgi:hypothetical protein
MLIQALLIAQLSAPVIINKPLPLEKKLRDTTKNYIVLHYDDGGSYEHVRRTLIKSKNSYHYYIARDGTIYNLVDTKYAANHAGVSYYKGYVRLNNYSIGICFQNKPPQKYTSIQYKNASWLIKKLQTQYKDSTAKIIIGHSNIAFPRHRKSDPGKHFNWNIFNKLLRN